jgi:hypothetical protein
VFTCRRFSFRGWLRLSQPSDRRLGHEWTTRILSSETTPCTPRGVGRLNPAVPCGSGWQRSGRPSSR